MISVKTTVREVKSIVLTMDEEAACLVITAIEARGFDPFLAEQRDALSEIANKIRRALGATPEDLRIRKKEGKIGQVIK